MRLRPGLHLADKDIKVVSGLARVPDRECPEPDQITFGSVTASGRLFGARTSYSCQHGYHVVGLQSRTCQADGQWAGTAPACKQNSKHVGDILKESPQMCLCVFFFFS